MIDFLSEERPQRPVTGITRNHLKVMTSLSKNSKQQGQLIKATTETDCQDRPKFRHRQEAKHWNITKIQNFFQQYLLGYPAMETESMLNKAPLLLQYNNQGGHATWYPRYLCLTVHHLPMSKLAQVYAATVSLAN